MLPVPLNSRRIRRPASGRCNASHFKHVRLSRYPLGEYDSAGNAIRENMWLNGMPVAMFTPDPAAGANAASSPPLVYFIHADHLNTPRVLVDNTNAMRWRWLGEPFGTTAPETSPQGLHSLTFNLRHPGQFYDVESGMFYNLNRDYVPGAGRYTQSDPIGLAGGIDTYGYVGGNPVSYIDPYGLSKFDPFYGLPKDFWNWYHRRVKKPADPDLPKKEAEELCDEWKKAGKPGPDNKSRQKGSADPYLLDWLIPWWATPSPLACSDLVCPAK